MNLGNAWVALLSEIDAPSMENAIRCFENALEVFTLEEAPLDRAITLNNLAVALRKNPDGDRAENFERAISVEHAALEVHTRNDFPWFWGEDHQELGLTWLAYAELKTDPDAIREALETAVECFKNTLEVWTEETYPHDFPTAEGALNRTREWLETGEDPGE